MNKNTQVLLHLSLIKGIGPAATLKLVQGLADAHQHVHKNPALASPEHLALTTLYNYDQQTFVTRFGVSQKIAQILVSGLADLEPLETELELINKYKIDMYSFLDPAYPELLKNIFHPPLILYTKGTKLETFEKLLAIVGARKSDGYAREAIKTIVPALVQHKWTIVSGGARGVDSIAHETTLASGGNTIAVLGSGLLTSYPPENKNLFRSIVQNGGTLISPFPLHTPPDKGTFPARNRIIAGICIGTVIVQAAQKSGALITAEYALEQGRQVFAIPGPIGHELSAGCHALIQQGAKLVTCAADILEEIDPSYDVSEKHAPVQPVRPERSILDSSSRRCKVEGSEHPTNHILKALTTPCSLDELSAKTKLTPQELQSQLFELQLAGQIKQNHAGLWESTK